MMANVRRLAIAFVKSAMLEPAGKTGDYTRFGDNRQRPGEPRAPAGVNDRWVFAV